MADPSAIYAPDPSLVERFRADLAAVCGPGSDRLLVAVSGGADSLALLLLARAALGHLLSAATVDHGIRAGAGSEADMVAATCRALGVPHAVLRGRLPPRVGGSANLSARARALRYRLLEEHRIATGCELVATAHHADDQLETMVMRLNRGAGVAGLAGVRARTGRVVRPLLGWRRAELAGVVSAAGLAPALDPSNEDGRFDRARVRRSLADADWLDAGRWRRSAAALAQTEDALRWTVRHLAEVRVGLDGEIVLLRLADDPDEIARRLLLHCMLRIDPDAQPRGEEVTRLLARARSARERPGGIVATLAGVLVSTREEAGGLLIRFDRAPLRRRA